MSFFIDALNTVVSAAETVVTAVVDFVVGFFDNTAAVCVAVGNAVVGEWSMLGFVLAVAFIVLAFKFSSFGLLVLFLVGLYTAFQVAASLVFACIARAIMGGVEDLDLEAL